MLQILLIAGRGVANGFELPYNYTLLHYIMVPRVLKPPATVQAITSHLVHPFDPSANDTPSADISAMDHVMACFFRILPVLELETVMNMLTLYLANRNYIYPVWFTSRHCPRQYLLDCLVAGLDYTTLPVFNPAITEDTVLQAICAILNVENWDFRIDVCWHEREDYIYTFMSNRGLSTSPKFLYLSALLRARKLSSLIRERYRVDAFDKWRIFITHPFLSPSPEHTPITQDSSREEMAADLSTRIYRAIVLSLTDFTLACLEATDQPYLEQTMRNIRDCLSPLCCRTVDSDTMVNFAEAWLTLVNRVISNPENVELKSIADKLLGETPAVDYYNPIATPIFKEALTTYHQFLVQALDRNTAEQVEHWLDRLAVECGDVPR
ncbi:hypothetical protein DFH06DRAFT_379440 [Mycena polygramma]|nr:hypothetical protein DFH06DRAFT_379440 [Mycena polygramma]